MYTRQLNAVISALQTFGADNVEGITVGNEVILDAFTANKSAGQKAGEAAVLANVKTTKAKISALNLSKQLPVGTGDSGSMITTVKPNPVTPLNRVLTQNCFSSRWRKA